VLRLGWNGLEFQRTESLVALSGYGKRKGTKLTGLTNGARSEKTNGGTISSPMPPPYF
jgi:hypothetical protein